MCRESPTASSATPSTMKFRLATAALASAVARRGEVAGCVVHSDRGSQFRSRRFVQALGRCDVRRAAGSMGRVGAAGDNAAMEVLLQPAAEQRTPSTAAAGRPPQRTSDRDRHLDRTTPTTDRRRQIALGRLTPVEFEAHHDHTGQSGRVTGTVTYPCSRPRRYRPCSRPLH